MLPSLFLGMRSVTIFGIWALSNRSCVLGGGQTLNIATMVCFVSHQFITLGHGRRLSRASPYFHWIYWPFSTGQFLLFHWLTMLASWSEPLPDSQSTIRVHVLCGQLRLFLFVPIFPARISLRMEGYVSPTTPRLSMSLSWPATAAMRW